VLPFIYTSRASLSKSWCETKRRCQAAKISHRAPPSSPTAAAPLTTPPTSTSALPSSARASPLHPMDRRRLRLGPRPFSRGPPSRRRPRAPRRPLTSSPSATAPLPYRDDVFLPAGPFPNRQPGTATDSSVAASADSSTAPAHHRRLISSPLATHGGWGWGRRRSEDRPGSVVFFFFFQNAITCV
jgi:hypothetical protein